MVDEVKYEALAFSVNTIPKWSSDYGAEGVDWDFNISKLRPWKWKAALWQKKGNRVVVHPEEIKHTREIYMETHMDVKWENIRVKWYPAPARISANVLVYLKDNQSLSWENKRIRGVLRGVKLHRLFTSHCLLADGSMRDGLYMLYKNIGDNSTTRSVLCLLWSEILQSHDAQSKHSTVFLAIMPQTKPPRQIMNWNDVDETR